MVGGKGEHRGQERLRHGVDAAFEVLEERFVPDAPGAVKVRLVGIGFPAVFGLESALVGKSGQRQGLPLRTMVKRRGIAFTRQFGGKTADTVAGVRRQDERLLHGRDAAKDGRLGVNAHPPAGKTVTENHRLLHQGVQEGHMPRLRHPLKGRLIRTVRRGETLQNQDYHVFPRHGIPRSGYMHGIEHRLQRFPVGIPVLFGIGRRIDRAEHAERRIKHNPRLFRMLDIQAGVIDADRPHGNAETAPKPANQRIQDCRKDGCMNQIIRPPVRGRHGLGLTVGLDQKDKDSQPQQYQVPMHQGFVKENAREVIIPLELPEDIPGRAGAREGEVDRVAQIDHGGQEIGDDEQPPGQLPVKPVFPKPERKERQEQVRKIQIQDGRQVKAETALEKTEQAVGGKFRIQVPVHQVEDQPAQRKHRHGQQKIPQGCAQIGAPAAGYRIATSHFSSI